MADVSRRMQNPVPGREEKPGRAETLHDVMQQARPYPTKMDVLDTNDATLWKDNPRYLVLTLVFECQPS